MSLLKKALLWLWMLTKRLYKKPLFALILISLPLTTVLYRTATNESGGGMVTVALAQEAEDSLAHDLIHSLPGSSQLVNWKICESPDEGLTLLRSGKIDALWVFPGNLKEKIEAFADSPGRNGGFITVYERQDSVALALCRERLSGLVYPQIARQVYLNFIREEFPALDTVSDEDLLTFYENTTFDERLFQFASGGVNGQPPSLLLSPLRGLIAMLVQLCALAAAMYYLEDRKNGTFAWVKISHQWMPELACQLMCVLQIAAVALLCILLGGLSSGVLQEIALMALYALCCSGFAMALRRLIPKVGLLAVLTPLLCIAMLVFCPIFFDLGIVRPLQRLFPLGWYLQRNFLGLGLYTLGCFSFVAITQRFEK